MKANLEDLKGFFQENKSKNWRISSNLRKDGKHAHSVDFSLKRRFFQSLVLPFFILEIPRLLGFLSTIFVNKKQFAWILSDTSYGDGKGLTMSTKFESLEYLAIKNKRSLTERD